MADLGRKGMIAIAPKAPRPPAVVSPVDPLAPQVDPAAAESVGMSARAAPRPSVADTRMGSMAAVQPVPTVGDRVGSYVVERLIGAGGMGLVLAARHEVLGELVAIKLLRPKAAMDKIHSERFAREARSMVKIRSEHVVRVRDAGSDEGGAPYIVMEYLVGRDLAQILREEGRLHHGRAADVMLQVCEAVASAHAVGVVHRDLKPSNFFLTQRSDGAPLVKVLDFGISKAVETDGVDPNLTETQAVFGSPTYMSPEQIRSAKHVDHRSDIWSLGVGLYELVTGKLPFAADNVAGLLASIVADPPFLPSAFAPELPPGLEELLLALLAKDPAQRVQSVAELAVRLAPFATQGGSNDALVDRIARLANAPKAPVESPTGGPVPQAPPSGGAWAVAEVAASAVAGAEGAARPELLPQDSEASRVAFERTGTALSADAPAPRRSTTAALAAGIGVCVLVTLVAVVAHHLIKAREPAATTVAPPLGDSPSARPPGTISSPVSADPSRAPSTVATPKATATTTGRPVSSTPRKPLRRGGAKPLAGEAGSSKPGPAHPVSGAL